MKIVEQPKGVDGDCCIIYNKLTFSHISSPRNEQKREGEKKLKMLPQLHKISRGIEASN